MKITSRIFILLLAFSVLVQSGYSAPVKSEHVEAELVSAVTSVQPGESFLVAVRLKMDPHWHTYWKNPGDAGLATSIDWDLPAGFEASEIRWPPPERIALDPLVNFGYEDEVFLLTEITATASIVNDSVTLRAAVKWLECKEICLPAKVKLELTLPVSSSRPEPDRKWAQKLAEARASLPVKSPSWSIEAAADETAFLIYAKTEQLGGTDMEAAAFFPFEEGLIVNAAPQEWARIDEGYLLRVKRSAQASELPERLTGVLVMDSSLSPGQLALEIDAPIRQGLSAPAGTSAQDGGGEDINPFLAIAFAFLGGMILNLMPCVFPVLSIKILGLVNQSGSEADHARKHGWIFAMGVLVSFWVLAGTLLLLRAGGEHIGWGFQLQSPAILTILASVLFALGLSLFGIFEIGLSLTSVGSGVSARTDAAGSFFSGILATVVATPCTAPFMGAALGFALTQPAWMSMLVFTALGAGMALPYVILTSHPRYLRFLPKPGPWMETLKQVMGFILMATVIWLLWVLGLQTGAGALIAVLGGLLMIAVGAWILGRWGAIHRMKKVRTAGYVFGLALILLGASFAVLAARNARPAAAGLEVEGEGIRWEKYTPERFAEVRAENRPVFIDFTAAWCLSCQVNERVAFSSREVQKKFEDLNVAALKADWTQRDETVTKALASYGRNSVPLYVLYAAGTDSDPVLLPEIITPQIVLNAFADL
ncbi:MAG: thioredoxin family protein [Verrucomicrobia bacterium]|nr:thioredoxin family protein [Verrucomicrobiota bacterium]